MPHPTTPAPSHAQCGAAARAGAAPGLSRSLRRRFTGLRRIAVLLAAWSQGGCAPGTVPTTFAVPSAAAARIRVVCPPDTFIGTMTVDCPRPLSRAAP